MQASVEDARDHVDGDFDIVYASWGWHIWLPDLDAWAGSVASLLRPGGFVYVADQHPASSTYGGSYFRDEPERDDSTGTYADLDAVTVHNEAYEWHHTMGDLVTAVASAGLRVELLHEHPIIVWQNSPEMVQGDDEMWRLPGDPLPLSFSLKARAGSGAP